MGTIADKLNYLIQTKNAIMNAIIAKGVEVTSSDTFRSYAEKISQIVSGGGSDKGIHDIVTIRPNHIDNPKISTVINAYSEQYLSRLSIGSLVQLNHNIATFTGSSADNLCAITGNQNVYLKVKYVNNYEYNPIVVFYQVSDNTNGIWMYGGKIGSDYSASDGEVPWVDKDGYCYVSIQDGGFGEKHLSWFSDKDYTNDSRYRHIIHTIPAANITNRSKYIGGRADDTYLHTNIDLGGSYWNAVNEQNKLYQKSYVVVNNNPPEPEF